MNLHRNFIFPKKECIDFFFTRKGIYVIALILSGSTSTPLFTMICPKGFPSNTAKILFLGLRDISYFQHRSKIWFKWCRWLDIFFENIVKLLIYATMIWLIIPWNSISIAHWNVALTLTSANGILLNVNVPHFIRKVLLSLLGSKTRTSLYP